MAVRKAVKSGRLKASVGQTADGRPCIVDAAKALEEWTANGGRNHTEHADEGSHQGDLLGTKTLTDARTLATMERAKKLRLENQQTRGKLIDLSVATKQAFEATRIIREALLNLPPRLSAELA